VLQRRDGGYGFVHDRVREALLGALTGDERRGLHQRIAEAMEARGDADVYTVARHYAAGDTARTPVRLYETGRAAGLRALDEHAPDTAVEFLEPALATGVEPDGLFREALGRAYLACGRADAAATVLEAAHATEPDRTRRASLSLRLAVTNRVRMDLERSTAVAWRGLAEAGHLLPRRPFAAVLWTFAQLARWIVAGAPGSARHPAAGDSRERLRIAVELCQVLGMNMYMTMKSAWTIPLGLHTARLAARIGPSTEYARGVIGLASLAGMLRMRRRRDRYYRVAAAAAQAAHDPAAVAYVAYVTAVVDSVVCGGPRDELVRTAVENRRWLEPDMHLNIVAMRGLELSFRGYPVPASELLERSVTAGIDPGAADMCAAARPVIDAMLGRPADAAEILAGRCGPGATPNSRVSHALAAVATAAEQGELGESFEEAVALFERIAGPVAGLMMERRFFFVQVAFARLELLRRERGDEQAAVRAVRALGRAANTDLLRAYHQVARAGLAVLAGRHETALRLLAGAEPAILAADAPLLEFEEARVRARALRGLGREAVASRQARAALALAGEHGWVHRARWVRAEFGVAESARRTDPGYSRRTSVAAGDRYRRRLEALQQVSLAAATVVEPRELARVALDETLRILGAERAMLFLAEDGGLRISVGRTAAGEDLADLSGYSTTLVDRVAETRQAVVVTGSEQGAALGSQSALVYGLRSIMVAPLELDGRLLGVVYLDSRVAKGVFTDRDIDILTAVNSHIAVSLETARAAQLEVAVQAAHQQRDVAERLRDAMGRLGGVLDPEEVRRVLLAVVEDVSPADRAYLVYDEEGALTVTGLDDPSLVDARALACLDVPLRDDPLPARNVAALAGAVGAWVAVPVRTNACGNGVLLATAVAEGAFGDEHLQLIAAIAGHGAAAYENARLYTRVQQLATTDALTGVSNRRHFADHAVRQIALARRNHRPLAAMMVDIDFFKKINDTYGHAVGDEVIRRVAGALRDNVREPDVLCRYGGEEFAIVMSEMHGDPIAAAERLRAAIKASGGDVPVTVSVGVAELKPDDDLETLLGRADAALYRAKEGGRDQVQAG
jgi:diguanylate cyclase (GGDEF)-like protein